MTFWKSRYQRKTPGVSDTFSGTLLVLIMVLAISCSKENGQPEDTLSVAQPAILKDQAYGQAARHKADVYLPAGRSKDLTRVMLLVHGGSWIEGDKTDLNPYITVLQKSLPNIALVNINYHLANGTPENRHPRQMEDIQTALAWIDANATRWNVGGTRVLLGVSAGAHLCLLYSYAFDPNRRIKAAGSLVGPTNLGDPFYTSNTLFQNVALSYIGKTWQQDSALHKQLSPVWQVTASAPPTFLAYGGIDPLVPISNPEALKARLTQLNVPYVYHLFPNEGHEFSMPAATEVVSRLAQFMEQYGK